jgi:CubicO group peptidase (beta-lactamase class C family)
MRTFNVDISGSTSEEFAPLVNPFARSVAYGGGSGASLAVYRSGHLVVDLVGGDYDVDSLQLQYSVAKLITAIVVAHAANRGLLDLDEPMSVYWKEFDRERTRGITARMVLGHTSGLAGIPTTLSVEELIAGRYLQEIERQDPYWEPGTRPGYHSFSYGILLDEIFRRRVGSNVGSYFDKEIRRPLDLDASYGASPEQLKRVKLYRRELEGRTPLARALPTLRDFVDNGSSVFRGDFSVGNRPDILAQTWPGMSIVASSRAMAKMLAATLTEIDGLRVLEPTALAALRQEQSSGIDWVLQYQIRFGNGVQLPFPQLPFTGPNAFGHQGAGGCVSFVDPDLDIAVSYNTDAFPACEGGSMVALALFSVIRNICEAA